MADFAVKVALRDERHVVYTMANGSESEFEIVIDDLSRKLVERFNEWVAKENTPYERADLELLGQLLYQALFPVIDARARANSPGLTIRQLFENDYAQFYRQSSDSDRFRLTLELHEDAPKLARFPWEFLFIPEDTSASDRAVDRGFFFAGQRNKLILTRFVPNVPVAELVVKEGAPLRILVVFSHPQELPNIDSMNTRDLISGIVRFQDLKNVEVRVEQNITFDDLRNLMNLPEPLGDAERPVQERASFRPDIFHFIGHGRDNQLALMRDKDDIQADKDEDRPLNDARWCVSQDVKDLFADHRPRLVFLHACESARSGSVESFSDLARDLVYSRIPCVIAMQYAISNRDAGLFAQTFYEEIRKGVPIDEAVRVGRAALGQSQDKKKLFGDKRFGTPVVYFQQKSGQPLVKLPSSSQSSGSSLRPTSTLSTQGQDPAASEKRVCPRCGEDGADEFCSECGLMFRCPNVKCRKLLEKPMSKFCNKCKTRIEQEPYTPPAVTFASAGQGAAEPSASSSFDVADDRAKHEQFSPKAGVTLPADRKISPGDPGGSV